MIYNHVVQAGGWLEKIQYNLNGLTREISIWSPTFCLNYVLETRNMLVFFTHF